MRNILICGYRDWAFDLYQKVDEREIDNCIYVDDKDLLERMIDYYQPVYVFFIGWSWIIKEDIINNYPCICLHPSPLPKYRGGSPIQNQIINNETMSAVTIFKMNKQIDAGDIIRQLPMSLCGNIEDILDRMTQLGFSGTCDFLKNGYNFVEQDDDEMTYFSRRKPHQSEITLEDISTQSVEYIYNKIRMLRDPFPNAYIKDRHGKKLFITEAYYE